MMIEMCLLCRETFSDIQELVFYVLYLDELEHEEMLFVNFPEANPRSESSLLTFYRTKLRNASKLFILKTHLRLNSNI